jgi:hypothetical protein
MGNISILLGMNEIIKEKVKPNNYFKIGLSGALAGIFTTFVVSPVFFKIVRYIILLKRLKVELIKISI